MCKQTNGKLSTIHSATLLRHARNSAGLYAGLVSKRAVQNNLSCLVSLLLTVRSNRRQVNASRIHVLLNGTNSGTWLERCLLAAPSASADER